MKLPPHSANSQKGQILIVFLLVLVVGLAIALSIASRSVTDIRQTTTSDESNRAYYAAEAGVENALKKIEDGTIGVIPAGGSVQTPINLSSINNSNAAVTVSNLEIPANTIFEYPALLNKDDVAQINLMQNFNDISTAGDPLNRGIGIRSSDTLDIYWDKPGSGLDPAIEVSIVACDGAPNCSNSSAFTISKMVFDPAAAAHGNNFCSAVVGAGGPVTTNLGNNITFRYKVSLTLNSNAGCLGNDAVSSSLKPVLARIRVLYSGSVIVGVGSPANRLPIQGYKVQSLGTTSSGVSRKLVVSRLFPALPAVFDYVLYNGSTTSPLTK